MKNDFCFYKLVEIGETTSLRLNQAVIHMNAKMLVNKDLTKSANIGDNKSKM